MKAFIIRKPKRTSRKTPKRLFRSKNRKKSISKSHKRLIRSKNRKKSISKIKTKFGRNDEHGAGAEEKKEDISHVHSFEEEYLKFYDDLPFEETAFENSRYSVSIDNKELFKELYNSNDLITITDTETSAYTSGFKNFRNLFMYGFDCYGNTTYGPMPNIITMINEFNRLSLSETDWNKTKNHFVPYKMVLGFINELDDLKRKIKINEKIIFVCKRCTQRPSGHAGDQGHGRLFVFTNYGKLIRNDFTLTGYLLQDFDTLLHPEAFEIMKKLWELYEREQGQHRYYVGNVTGVNGVIDFFKNVVDISNALRAKDKQIEDITNTLNEKNRQEHIHLFEQSRHKDKKIKQLKDNIRECLSDKELLIEESNNLRGVDPQWYTKIPRLGLPG